MPLTKEKAEAVISEISMIDTDDGVSFEIKKIEDIMEEHDYSGIRFTIEAIFEKLRDTIKIDICFVVIKAFSCINAQPIKCFSCKSHGHEKCVAYLEFQGFVHLVGNIRISKIVDCFALLIIIIETISRKVQRESGRIFRKVIIFIKFFGPIVSLLYGIVDFNGIFHYKAVKHHFGILFCGFNDCHGFGIKHNCRKYHNKHNYNNARPDIAAAVFVTDEIHFSPFYQYIMRIIY